jgi:hypothetical protein
MDLEAKSLAKWHICFMPQPTISTGIKTSLQTTQGNFLFLLFLDHGKLKINFLTFSNIPLGIDPRSFHRDL